MLKLHDSKVLSSVGWEVILQVHDDIILEGPEFSGSRNQGYTRLLLPNIKITDSTVAQNQEIQWISRLWATVGTNRISVPQAVEIAEETMKGSAIKFKKRKEN